MDYAFEYIEKDPLMLESAYPYHAKKKKCEYVKSEGKGKVYNYVDVKKDASGE